MKACQLTIHNTGQQSQVRARACAVCVAHTKDLMENLRRLTKNLTNALPKSRKKEIIARTEIVANGLLSITEHAEYISSVAKELANLPPDHRSR
jgi:hypothetical protein